MSKRPDSPLIMRDGHRIVRRHNFDFIQTDAERIELHRRQNTGWLSRSLFELSVSRIIQPPDAEVLSIKNWGRFWFGVQRSALGWGDGRRTFKARIVGLSDEGILGAGLVLGCLLISLQRERG